MPRPRRSRLATRWTEDDIDYLRFDIPLPGSRWLLRDEDINVPKTDAELAEMRQCYAAHRDAICLPTEEHKFATRPWSFWEFEATEQRDMKTPEHVQLRQLGELTADEIRYLEVAPCHDRN